MEENRAVRVDRMRGSGGEFGFGLNEVGGDCFLMCGLIVIDRKQGADMTEQEWMECADPTPMREFVRDKVSDRKMHL